MDKSLALKLCIQVVLLTAQYCVVDAGPSWDFDLDDAVTGLDGYYNLPAAFNTFGIEQLRIRVI